MVLLLSALAVAGEPEVALELRGGGGLVAVLDQPLGAASVGAGLRFFAPGRGRTARGLMVGAQGLYAEQQWMFVADAQYVHRATYADDWFTEAGLGLGAVGTGGGSWFPLLAASGGAGAHLGTDGPGVDIGFRAQLHSLFIVNHANVGVFVALRPASSPASLQ